MLNSLIKDSNPQHFINCLIDQYPKLEKAGGFELLRTCSRSLLDVIKPPKQGYTSEYLADSCAIGQSIIYIRPLQKDLDLDVIDSVEPSEDCPLEQCIHCEDYFPIIKLKTHISEIHENVDLPLIKLRKSHKDSPICKYTCSTSEANNTVQNVEINSDDENSKIACPICGVQCIESMIESHAAICGDNLPKEVALEAENRKQFNSLTEELENMKATIFKDAPKYSVSVLRKQFLLTAMQNLEDVDYKSVLNIIFIGEEGVDAGGLTREFFTLLFAQTPVIENDAFSIDCDLLSEKLFLKIGQAVAYCILIGNQGPHCLGKHLVNYILHNTVPNVEDIPIQSLPMSVTHAIENIEQTEDKFNDTFSMYADMFQTAGFLKVLNHATKKEAINALKNHFGFYRFLPQMLQFIKGLELHGVLEILRRHPTEAADLFAISQTTCTQIINFFKPSYSVKSEEKEEEEIIVYNFHRFIKKIEKGNIVTSSIDIMNLDAVCDFDKTLSIEDFLKATTGSSTLVRNITQGLLLFDHISNKCSTVNTCAPSITVNQIKKNQDYAFFETSMINIIVGAQGFGMV